jgi:hypothetical protein
VSSWPTWHKSLPVPEHCALCEPLASCRGVGFAHGQYSTGRFETISWGYRPGSSPPVHFHHLVEEQIEECCILLTVAALPGPGVLAAGFRITAVHRTEKHSNGHQDDWKGINQEVRCDGLVALKVPNKPEQNLGELGQQRRARKESHLKTCALCLKILVWVTDSLE